MKNTKHKKKYSLEQLLDKIPTHFQNQKLSMTNQSKKTGKTIILGVCGGIAAYKACEVARLLIKSGHSVHVMMTKAATEFVTPLTFQALTGNPVATDLFSLTQESQIGHIQLADKADVVLIAPATADMLAKAAYGFCDDIVSTVLLATKAPIIFAPSMNVNMFENPITQENMTKLRKLGNTMIEPDSGFLACGWEGKGRLAEPEVIIKAVHVLLKIKS